MRGGRRFPSNRASRMCERSQRRSLKSFGSLKPGDESIFFAGQAILVRPGDRDARHERRLSHSLLILIPGHPEGVDLRINGLFVVAT